MLSIYSSTDGHLSGPQFMNNYRDKNCKVSYMTGGECSVGDSGARLETCRG